MARMTQGRHFDTGSVWKYNKNFYNLYNKYLSIDLMTKKLKTVVTKIHNDRNRWRVKKCWD